MTLEVRAKMCNGCEQCVRAAPELFLLDGTVARVRSEEVPQELLSMVTPDFQVRAMMTSDALGVSLGKDESGKLLPFMQLKGSDDGTFLSMEYDLAALAEAQNSFEGLAGVGGPEAEAWRTHHEALVKAYQSMLGRTRLEFRFTDEGLVVDSHTAFP